MKIMGIDPGGKTTGVVIIKHNKLLCYCKLTGETFTFRQKMKTYTMKIEEMIQKYKPSFVFCEEPFLRGKANKLMNRLLGAIEVSCSKQVSFVHPMTVKAHFSTVGKDKKELAKEVRKRLALTSRRDCDILISKEEWDITDALAVAFYGLDKYRK